jgi:hypothetical protein
MSSTTPGRQHNGSPCNGSRSRSVANSESHPTRTAPHCFDCIYSHLRRVRVFSTFGSARSSAQQTQHCRKCAKRCYHKPQGYRASLSLYRRVATALWHSIWCSIGTPCDGAQVESRLASARKLSDDRAIAAASHRRERFLRTMHSPLCCLQFGTARSPHVRTRYTAIGTAVLSVWSVCIGAARHAG